MCLVVDNIVWQVFVERGGCWSVGDDVVVFDILKGAVVV